MPLLALDHVNLRTANLAKMLEFYRDALGLEPGARPAFDFGGAWLYCEGHAVVHLVEVAEQPTPNGELRLEHFAFVARDFEAVERRLAATGVHYRASRQRQTGTAQLHVFDPDGNRIHIDFPEAPG